LLVHAIAGELDLDIYVISLSQRDMDDTALNRLITTLPPKAIVLMEDIDVAFTRGPSRNPPAGRVRKRGQQDGFFEAQLQGFSMGSSAAPAISYQAIHPDDAGSGNNSEGITLAGLLGAIDGVAAQEGRILFATTNRYHALDAALKRPGRLDIHVEFREASKKQAEELFKRFYPASKEVPEGVNEKPLIDLTSAELVSTGNGTSSSSSPSEKDYLPSSPGQAIPNGPPSPAPSIPTSRSALPNKVPLLTERELSILAKRFASLLPEREFSMAAIQGHLMRYKTQPHRAIEETEAFVKRERAQKESEAQARGEGVEKKEGQGDVKGTSTENLKGSQEVKVKEGGEKK
jgi:chaperone BCS1